MKIKKNPFVNLYESGGKVLCPATYSGLLSHYNNDDDDHIAVYSRRDDPFVGEKVIRGVIASNILDKDFSRNCLQVILSNYDEQELSIICKDTIKKTNEDFNNFLNKINQIQNSKGLVLL